MHTGKATPVFSEQGLEKAGMFGELWSVIRVRQSVRPLNTYIGG